MIMHNKKAAIELSIGTIVVIVIAMSMLILGLVLVRNIFTGATDNIITLNDKVKDQIKGLFQDDEEQLVIKLTENTAKMGQGETFGVAFGVRNTNPGGNVNTNFIYEVKSEDDSDPTRGCGMTRTALENWMRFKSGTMKIASGKIGYDTILFEVPQNAPLCTTKYKLTIYNQDRSVYVQSFFFVKIVSKGIFK